jgi:hypothetical protein
VLMFGSVQSRKFFEMKGLFSEMPYLLYDQSIEMTRTDLISESFTLTLIILNVNHLHQLETPTILILFDQGIY